MSVEQLITTGSGILILSAIVIAFYTSKVMTKSDHNAIVELVVKMWTERFNEVYAEKESWKSQAQQLTPAVASIAEGSVADRRKQVE
jgi:hypothetical protein